MLLRKNIVNQVERLVLSVWILLGCLPSGAQQGIAYTNNQPLVVVSDRDFPPYEYSNDDGKPAGLNIDVLDAILTKMDIPHKFVMANWDEAAASFEAHRADLILDALFQYNAAPYYSSRSSLNYYRIKAASRKGEPKVQSLEELGEATGVVIRDNDKASFNVLRHIFPDLKLETASPEDALRGIVSGRYNYFLWGEEPLKWKIKELNLQRDIVLSELDVTMGEIHFAGHDKALIDQIDDQYARLQQSGELDKIHDHWFHPERMHNDAPLVALYITLGTVVIILALLTVNRLIRKRVKATTRQSTDVENMMRHALSMSNYSVVEYDVKADHFTNRHGHMLPESGYSMQQFIAHVHHEEQDDIAREIERLRAGENGIWEVDMRWKAATEADWAYIHGHSIAELDDNGHTQYIVFTLKDVTLDYEQERKDNELATKYAKIFDSTLVAMSFYDKNGRLINLNQNMRRLCEFDETGEKFFRNSNIFDNALLKDDFDPKQKDSFHVCQHMHYPELGIDKYIECRVMPTYENGELHYYIVTARDITAERQMYIRQQEQDRELHRQSDIINRYEEELHYLLENSNMWVWRSDLKTRQISFSRSLKQNDFSESYEDFTASLNKEYLPTAMQSLGGMQGQEANFNTVLLFDKTPVSQKPQWCAISGIPTYDENGQLLGHIGVVRDITTLMRAQEQLRRETARAEDSGKLKSVFLANMTHEIRTPLNAIVGFSDLLQMIDDPQERREFIRIIRNNCDMLIRLINDIIEASNMNQGPLAIEAEDVDFAIAFNDICQTLAQRVEEPGVEFIVDNPYTSFVTHLDKGRLQQVITNFTTNAVKYTHQGHIKVGFRYLSLAELAQTTGKTFEPNPEFPDSGIYMYCEDTGAGIPKEKQGAVFERFVKLNDYVQGTGLGLSICKSISQRCGGHIGVSSQGEGHGSTFWVWIPCPAPQS